MAIYRIKRNPSNQFIQKEYGLISDIYHSGLKRTSKKLIGNMRKKAAARIDKSILSDLIENETAANRYMRHKPTSVGDENALKNLKKNIKRRGDIEVTIDPIYSGDNKATISRGKSRLIDQTYFKNHKRQHLIVDPKDNSTVELAHELGHIKNATGENGKLNKKINEIALGGNAPILMLSPQYTISNVPTIYVQGTGSKKARKLALELWKLAGNLANYENIKNIDDALNETGIRKGIKRFVKGKFRRLEEYNATKSGINDAKKADLQGRALKAETERMKRAGETYRSMDHALWKMPIRNRILIPSRRGEWNVSNPGKF